MTRIALVTGANKGIGFETVRELLARGVNAVIGARSAERGAAAAAALGTTFVRLDVTDAASVDSAAKQIEAEHGVLDILVNNAAIGGTYDGPSTTSLDTMRDVFESNVFGVVAVTNAFLPLIRRSPAGRIVNVSSEVGSLTKMGDPNDDLWQLGALAYPVSKTALNMVTVQYAKELHGTPIKVNAVTPGYCATDLNGHSGPRTAAQGAQIATRLALLDSGGPTGAFFDDNGTVPW
ncbi:SDR family oxidoreductase [Allorhizocola rhizosphaerae]|uniref:SDR family oxidoreductase n=1 Tax=Allorhizocola rhizosphaerae TaxID=1872709 RepID=UPI000E3DCE4B|nr:SDR family oxidoreductase [Allorhizocola rhizosphaerae]